jgi:hypothetical protein
MVWLAGTDSGASDTCQENYYQDRKASEIALSGHHMRRLKRAIGICDGPILLKDDVRDAKSIGDDMVAIESEVEEEREVGSSGSVLLRGCDEAGVFVAKL